MLRNDPYVRQESRRAVQSHNNQLRNLIQQDSNKLVAKANKLSHLVNYPPTPLRVDQWASAI
jgi:hypothetical protein